MNCACCEETAESSVCFTINDLEKNSEIYPLNYISTTKFNIWLFILYDILLQFRRASNLYFLTAKIISFIPRVSPIDPLPSLFPVIFVILVSIIKDTVEEVQRHLADRRSNATTVRVVRTVDGTARVVEVRRADVAVGDLVLLGNGEEVPADVVVLSSSEVEGRVFIDTASLDGESSAKQRRALEATWGLTDVEALVKARMVLRTLPPKSELLQWTGVLEVDGVEHPVGIDQFLYRSSILRNTRSAWGFVAYAGVRTKMYLNLEDQPPKPSSLEVGLNYVVAAAVLFQFIIIVIMSSLAVVFQRDNDAHWYMRYYLETLRGARAWGFRFLGYFTTTSYVVPLSLFVTLELCKIFQAFLMSRDRAMYAVVRGRWVRCVCNTSNLNDLLGRVQRIVTDKTGTLTENVMVFHTGDILGRRVGGGEKVDLDGAALRYFRALALCHTIQPWEDGSCAGGYRYEGESPDEAALVAAAAEHGVVLVSRTMREMTLRVSGVEEKYEVVETLEFSADRKMMSVILRDGRGGTTIYTKGADSSVMRRLCGGAGTAGQRSAEAALQRTASIGLRTLVIAARAVGGDELRAWRGVIGGARRVLVGREAAVDTACLQMERDLELVGVTAIEDRLQARVPETLRFFRDAGVPTWMATGDKRETAMSIARTCGLIEMSDAVVVLDVDDGSGRPPETSLADCLDALERSMSDAVRTVFVIDGVSLEHVLGGELRTRFLALATMAGGGVCCRLTPLQKAELVGALRRETDEVTLAVGDGANDVSMIKEASVGVGIIGLEGSQAQRAADYAVPKFHHLLRLCAVHGHYSVVRGYTCIVLSFYKNFLYTGTTFAFSFFCGFSVAELVTVNVLTFLNVLFTSIPPFILGIFEKDVPEDVLMDSPLLYREVSKGLVFTNSSIVVWLAEGAFHSVGVFFILYPLAITSLLSFRLMDVNMVGTILFSIVIAMAHTQFAMATRYWTPIQAGSIVVSISVYVLFLVVYAGLSSSLDPEFFQATYQVIAAPTFWMYGTLWVCAMIGYLVLRQTIAAHRPSTPRRRSSYMGT